MKTVFFKSSVKWLISLALLTLTFYFLKKSGIPDILCLYFFTIAALLTVVMLIRN